MTTFAALALIAGCNGKPAAKKTADAPPVVAEPAKAEVSAPIATGDLPVLKDKSYDAARAELIKLGYEPVAFTCTPKDALCANEDSGVKDYPEVIDCGGSGVRPCQFAWHQPVGDRYISVTTFGEIKLTVNDVTATTKANIQEGWQSRATLD